MDSGQSKLKGYGRINHAGGDDYYSPARRNTRFSVVYRDGSAKVHISTKLPPDRNTCGDLCVILIPCAM